MTTFNMKKGDRYPVARATLYNADGSLMNLTGATITFRMRSRSGGALKVNAAGTIVGDPTLGVVQYAWAVGDTDTVDNYDAEFAVSIGGLAQTVPASGYVLVVVEDVLS